VRLPLKIAVVAGANAIALLVAALLFDKFEINVGPFLVAVAIFSAAELIVEPVVTSAIRERANGVLFLAGLVTTFVVLLVTDLLSDGVQIEGVGTWIMATVIVWLVGSFALFVLRAVTPGDQSGTRRS
jgi:uncharacterized membrane protein YvlD (DUF360 family)